MDFGLIDDIIQDRGAREIALSLGKRTPVLIVLQLMQNVGVIKFLFPESFSSLASS